MRRLQPDRRVDAGGPGPARAGVFRAHDVCLEHVQRRLGRTRPASPSCTALRSCTAGSRRCSPACGSSGPATRSALWRSRPTAPSGCRSGPGGSSTARTCARRAPRRTSSMRPRVPVRMGDLHPLHAGRDVAHQWDVRDRLHAAHDHVLPARRRRLRRRSRHGHPQAAATSGLPQQWPRRTDRSRAWQFHLGGHTCRCFHTPLTRPAERSAGASAGREEHLGPPARRTRAGRRRCRHRHATTMSIDRAPTVADDAARRCPGSAGSSACSASAAYERRRRRGREPLVAPPPPRRPGPVGALPDHRESACSRTRAERSCCSGTLREARLLARLGIQPMTSGRPRGVTANATAVRLRPMSGQGHGGAVRDLVLGGAGRVGRTQPGRCRCCCPRSRMR